MFADLNIPNSNNRSELTERIIHAKNLGYGFIAVNRTVTGALQPKEHICNFKPVAIPDEKTQDTTSTLTFGPKNFQQLSRLTVVLDNPNQIHSLNASNPVIRGYDLLAIQPTTEKLFQQACTDLEIDIIVLSQDTRQTFPLRVPSIKAALERGVFFEICYSYALGSGNSSRYLMSNALNLIRVTKGKNIIFSSNANSYQELRSPYDVTSLGHLFGLDYQNAQNSLSINCSSVLHHSYARKTHKGVVAAQDIEEIPISDKQWKVPSLSVPKVGEKRKRQA